MPSWKNSPKVAMPTSHKAPQEKEFRIFLKYLFISGSIPELYSSMPLKITMKNQGTNKALNKTESPLKTLKSTLE